MASKNAATVTIAIEAQTATLKKGFDDAKQAISQLDSSMSRHVAMGIAKFKAGWLAVQGVIHSATGAIAGLSNAIREASEMQDWSVRLGMSADALTALGFAAEQCGSSQTTLNRALEYLQKTMGKALAGTKEAQDQFDRLGLSVKYLARLAPEEQFATIADAMQDVKLGAERTALAVGLFGRTGAELNETISLGSKGLREYADEAKNLGLMMGNARAGLEAAGDAMNAFNRSWGALKQRIAVGLGGPLAATMGWLAKTVGKIQGFDYEKEYKFVGSSQYQAKKAAQLEEMERLKKLAQEELAKAEEQMRSRAESITNSLKTPAENMKDEVAELNEMVKAGAISWGTYHRGIRRAVEELFKGKQAIKEWSTPGIGAVTRSSAEGFSALQEAKRQREDDERRHREEVEWLARIEAAVKASTIELVPVKI